MANTPFDPDARLDFAMEWGPFTDPETGEPDPGWLQDGEVIVSHNATGTGVTIDGSAVVGTQVVAWAKDGVIGPASILFEVTTDAGRTDQRTKKLNVKQR